MFVEYGKGASISNSSNSCPDEILDEGVYTSKVNLMFSKWNKPKRDDGK